MGRHCQCPLCPHPCHGHEPRELSVVLAGIGEAGCGSCANLNDTYILQWYGTSHASALPGCFWSITLDPPVCGVQEIWADFWHDELTGHYWLFIKVSDDTPDAFEPWWSVDLGLVPIDCGWDELELPNVGAGYTDWHDCDYSTGGTCTVTAL